MPMTHRRPWTDLVNHTIIVYVPGLASDLIMSYRWVTKSASDLIEWLCNYKLHLDVIILSAFHLVGITNLCGWAVHQSPEQKVIRKVVRALAETHTVHRLLLHLDSIYHAALFYSLHTLYLNKASLCWILSCTVADPILPRGSSSQRIKHRL